jgi:arginase
MSTNVTKQVRKCLAPFFVGQFEAGFDERRFDLVLPKSLVAAASSSVDAIIEVNRAIKEFVAKTIVDGEMPAVLCGDCLSAIGAIAGLEKSGIMPDYLLWFDAHGDFHTAETSISGHLGGMPLAMITGRGDQEIMLRVGVSGFSEAQICHIGARDLESGEYESLKNSQVLVSDSVAGVVELLPSGSTVWIHFDTDYINPLDAPAMRYPAAGGPRAPYVQNEIALVVREFAVLGLSASAWAPHLESVGGNKSTAEVCRQVLSVICDF